MDHWLEGQYLLHKWASWQPIGLDFALQAMQYWLVEFRFSYLALLCTASWYVVVYGYTGCVKYIFIGPFRKVSVEIRNLIQNFKTFPEAVVLKVSLKLGWPYDDTDPWQQVWCVADQAGAAASSADTCCQLRSKLLQAQLIVAARCWQQL